MYGTVKYFVPEWGSTIQNDQSELFRNMSLKEI